MMNKSLVDKGKKAWSDLHVPENIVRSLVEQKFYEPTPIQRLTLPAAIQEHLDIIGTAETVGGNAQSNENLSLFSSN